MNREEAIKELEYAKIKLREANVFPSMNPAIDMAIEALQWQDRILTQLEDIVLKEHGERREP